ncbi:MAG TPA: glycerol-3-phosphate dehydrogenase, partial [Steroidobacteraceae bacterium]|nr:glycerol-3-phosphate dehydrogenase [Steroidobacteraceae bacterium]
MARLPEDPIDLLVVGGGINGCGIARDAAGRGWKVLLAEQDDLAAHTSSASTKLIHGGLRYLEQLHFALVRKALREREVLLASAPHLIRPLRFVLPHDPRLRPALLVRAGLFLYDHLAVRHRLAASGAIDLAAHPAGPDLAARFRRAFVYSDAATDDARLVALTALDAAERGAAILTRTRCERLEREGALWTATLVDASGRRRIRARAAVNAAGPWVSRFLQEATPVQGHRRLRLVKGSHIVVPQLFRHRFAYIFQNPDRRIVFAIPWERAFTLIGTTDVEHHGAPGEAAVAPEEVEYLCAAANAHFRRQITPADVVWSYCGVRPLLEDAAGAAAEVTREYALDVDAQGAPLLSVFGGKLTTFRALAEEAVNLLATRTGLAGRAWTARGRLPGGDLPRDSFAVFLRLLARRHPWLPLELRERYARAYGTRALKLLGAA